jgi:hypothetical protein
VTPAIDSSATRRHPLRVSDAPHPDDASLPTLDGRALAFGLRLDAAEILAAEHANAAPRAASRHLFAALDPTLATRLCRGDVIVVEQLTGEETRASSGFAALAATGITAIVVRRVSPALAEAARATGVVIVVVDTPSFLHTGDRVRLDLDAAKVVNLSSGDRAAIRNLDDDTRLALHAALGRSAE